jgi:4-hydroxy-3-methylbut-2-enyl diphosphate reductase
VRASLERRYGPEEAAKRFLAFDTICSATQERQDAVHALLRDRSMDLLLVIGGYNSSNTTHLVEIAAEKVPAYHIQNAECVEDARNLRHQPLGLRTETVARDWLPEGRVIVGLTAGASTPNSEIGKVVERIASLRGGSVP